MQIDRQALRIMRERTGYSRTEFAKTLGISLQYLCDIEAGHRRLKRNPALIKRMAELLEVPVTMLQDAGPGEVA